MQFSRQLTPTFMAAIVVSLVSGADALAGPCGFGAHPPCVMEWQNATASVDPLSSSGMDSWTVDGTDHLHQQWFWYRVGDSGPEQSIDTLGLLGTNLVNNGLTAATLELLYGNNDLTIGVTYSLIGGADGSGTADLGEQITINNLGSSPLDLRFFQYVDFDLCGASGDTATITGGNTAGQNSGPGCIVSETVVTPPPSHFETGQFNNTLTSLEDGNPTTLNGNASFGPGDATWAFQWNRTIAAGGTFIISKDKHLETPEPGLPLLLGVGLAAAAALLRRGR